MKTYHESTFSLETVSSNVTNTIAPLLWGRYLQGQLL